MASKNGLGKACGWIIANVFACRFRVRKLLFSQPQESRLSGSIVKFMIFRYDNKYFR